jgi:hypothetical protein
MNVHRKSRRIAAALAIVSTVLLAAGSGLAAPDATSGSRGLALDDAPATARHVVVFDQAGVPAGFVDLVGAEGGTVLDTFGEIGVAVVNVSGPAAGRLATALGAAVESDAVLAAPVEEELAPATAAALRAPTRLQASLASPTAAAFYSRQWNMRAIGADTAWAAGHLGSSDVTAFLLDTGIDYSNPELVGHVDLARSVSFVSSYSPEDDLVQTMFPGRHPVTDLHSHGTAVAATIVSSGNVLAGVTQRTTLVGVKVHDRFRQAPVSNYVKGILYAANEGADVIHLSIPVEFSASANPANVEAVERAVKYAHKQGAVLIAAAGNAAVDLDADPDRFRFCKPRLVICVSATAPTSAASVDGPWVDPDAIAPYTNFGRDTIDVAGPGGVGNPGAFTTVWLVCSQTTIFPGVPQTPCRNGDPIWSSVGTTFGAAATSGLAALLVSVVGHGKPDRIERAIFRSADDLGARKTDAYYGKGRIDVVGALADVGH